MAVLAVTSAIASRWTRAAAVMAIVLGSAWGAHAQDASSLKAQLDSRRAALADNPFQRPLVLESKQDAGDLKGDVYAIVDQPFRTMAPALQSADQWCDLLILHLNVKGCGAAGKPAARVLSLVVGRKFDQPLDDGYPVSFDYAVPASGSDYLRVQMAADEGPVGTRDYQLSLEAAPLDERRSVIHLSYAYGYGAMARLAMQTYLATAGRDKVGFSVTGKRADGRPIHVGGVRGVIERNTMRYFLAIEAYLGALATPPRERQDKRLRDWFAATERYPRQLHEIDRDDYLTMKQHELQRQRAGVLK